MALELHDKTATLSGTVTVEEVEELAAWLRSTPRPRLNLRNCNHLHTAAFQAILAFAPKISAVPAESFLANWLLPVLQPPKTTTSQEAPHDDRDAG